MCVMLISFVCLSVCVWFVLLLCRGIFFLSAALLCSVLVRPQLRSVKIRRPIGSKQKKSAESNKTDKITSTKRVEEIKMKEIDKMYYYTSML